MRPRAKTNLEKMGFVDPDRKESQHDVLQLKILENPEKLINSISKSVLTDLKIESIKLEKPVLSKGYNSKFIVGYLDCFIEATFDSGKEHRQLINLAVEIKSKVESFGDTLRQINTYKEYFDHRLGVHFVVASEDDRYKEQFESQGIRFYDFKN